MYNIFTATRSTPLLKFHTRNIRVVALAVVLLAAFSSSGQIAGGTYSIPGSYATIAAAVTALNAAGISGAVTFNCAGGGTETAPAGGIHLGSAALNATTSAAKTITFKTASGTDYKITAGTGVGAADFIFAIEGTDYVTINGIDLAEAAGNTTSTTEMEYGYAFFLLNSSSPYDAPQNDEIENCTITLKNTNTSIDNINNTEGSNGIFAEQAVATAPTTAITASLTGDLFSSNKIYGNTIKDVTYGIYITGYGSSQDNGNDIGGSSSATQNTIQDLANATTAYPLIGIYANYQNNLNVSYNNVSNTAGGGAASTGMAIGIEVAGTASTYTVNNNTVNMTSGSSGIANAAPFNDGIYTPGTGTLTLNNNNITYTQSYVPNSTADAVTVNGILTYATGLVITTLTCSGNVVTVVQDDSLGTCYGINSGATATDALSGNTVSITNYGTSTTTAYGIAVASNSTGTINVTGNNVTASTGHAQYGSTSSFSNPGTYPGTYTASATQYHAQYIASALDGIYYDGTGAVTVSGNQVTMSVPNIPFVSDNACTVTYSGMQTLANCNSHGGYELAIPTYPTQEIYIAMPGGGTSEMLSGNIFTGNTVYGEQSYTLISDGNATATKTITGNYISGTLTRVNTPATILASYAPLGGYISYSSSGSATIRGNNFSNMVNDSGQMVGILYGGSANYTIVNNTITNLTNGYNGSGADVGCAGIYGPNTTAGATYVIDSNTISGISCGGGGPVFGIIGQAGTIAYNNVNNISVSSGAGAIALGVTVAGIELEGPYQLPAIGAVLYNVYDNKIYDVFCNATGGTIAAGICLESAVSNASYAGTFNIYNNCMDSITNPASTIAAPSPVVSGLYMYLESKYKINFQYNSVYLSGSSASNFFSSGVYNVFQNATYSDTVLLQNNIIYNGMTPNGATSKVVAFYDAVDGAAAGPVSYAAASNNNMLYAGTPGPNNLIYYDEVNSEQTLANEQSYFTAYHNQDAASISNAATSTYWLSTSGSSPTFLQQVSTSSPVYNTGLSVSGITTDYWGLTRAGSAG
jgi:hypothetical protein